MDRRQLRADLDRLAVQAGAEHDVHGRRAAGPVSSRERLAQRDPIPSRLRLQRGERGHVAVRQRQPWSTRPPCCATPKRRSNPQRARPTPLRRPKRAPRRYRPRSSPRAPHRLPAGLNLKHSTKARTPPAPPHPQRSAHPCGRTTTTLATERTNGSGRGCPRAAAAAPGHPAGPPWPTNPLAAKPSRTRPEDTGRGPQLLRSSCHGGQPAETALLARSRALVGPTIARWIPRVVPWSRGLERPARCPLATGSGDRRGRAKRRRRQFHRPYSAWIVARRLIAERQ